MHLQCELSAKYVLPLFRSKVAKILVNEYRLTQNEVANLLSISQATVSLYLGERRGRNKNLNSLKNLDLIDHYARAYAEELMHGSLDGSINNYFCSLCGELFKKSAFCSTHENVHNRP